VAERSGGAPLRMDPRARTVGLAMLAVALAAGVHAFELHGRFVYDDLVYVVYNAAVQRGLGANWTRFFTDHTLYSGVVHTVHYRPLVALSYAANASPDLTSFAFKVTQVALHALTVLGLFWSLTVLRRHRPEVPAAVPFLAAVWVGIVPFNVEAVHYVAARSSLMCGTFAAWAFGLYLRMRLASRPAAVAGWYVAHLLAVGAALSCKETALALPAAMVAADLWLVRPGSTGHRMRGLRPWWPYLPYVAGLAFVLLVMPNVNHTYGYLRSVFTDPWRLAIAFWCLVENLRLMVLGTGLTAVHPVDPDAGLLTPTTAGVLLLLLALAAGCWAVRRRLPLVGFGYLWYLFLIAPSTFVHLNQILQEHRAYTASFGVGMALAALAGALWERAARHRPAVVASVVAGIAAVGLLLAVGAVHRERVWASGLSLWSDAAAHAPGSYLARINLGLMRMNAGDLKGAERELRWAFDSKPSAHARHGLAQVLGREGRYREALDLLAPMVEMFPDDPRVLFEVARARVGMGPGPEAVESLKRLDAAERENLRTRRYKYLYRPGATAAEVVRVALAAGRLDDARWGVARLREEAPDDPTGDRMAFAVHLAAGEIEAAEADLAALDRRLPGDPRVAALRARLEAAKTGPSGPPPTAP
jgi:tetratricopeptide (TPR) repeat protein